MQNQKNITNKNLDFSFGKEERLCSKKVIDKLFSDGASFLNYPLKVIYLTTPLPTNKNVQAAFTVSKKKFKHAVKRNLLKRRLRESYRLNKHILTNNLNTSQLAIFFVYVGKETLNYDSIEKAMKKSLKKLAKKLELNQDTKYE